jgi:hypothetical protein
MQGLWAQRREEDRLQTGREHMKALAESLRQ